MGFTFWNERQKILTFFMIFFFFYVFVLIICLKNKKISLAAITSFSYFSNKITNIYKVDFSPCSQLMRRRTFKCTWFDISLSNAITFRHFQVCPNALCGHCRFNQTAENKDASVWKDGTYCQATLRPLYIVTRACTTEQEVWIHKDCPAVT